MINILHLKSKNLGYKLIIILFSVLIIILWSIGDIILLKPNNINNIVLINNANINQKEFLTQLKKNIIQTESSLGYKLSYKQLNQLKIPQLTLNKIIQMKLLNTKAKKLGINVSNSNIKRIIYSNSYFNNKKKTFDQNIFKNFLYNEKITEQEYIKNIKNKIIQEQIIKIINKQLIKLTPEFISELLFYWKNEKREIQCFQFSSKLNNIFHNPKKNKLITFQQNYSTLFNQTEKKNITYIILNKQYINQNKKIINNILKSIKNDLIKNQTLEKISNQYNLKLKNIELSTSSINNKIVKLYPEINISNFIKTTIKISEKQTSQLIYDKSQNLYFIIHVNKICEKKLGSFYILKNKITKLWKEKFNNNIIKNKIKNIFIKNNQNALKNNLHKKYIFTRNGPNNIKLKNKLDPNITNKIFNLKVGETLITHINNDKYTKYLILKFNKIIPINHYNKNIKERTKFNYILGTRLSNNIFNIFIQDLEKKYNIHINKALINKLLSNPNFLKLI